MPIFKFIFALISIAKLNPRKPLKGLEYLDLAAMCLYQLQGTIIACQHA